MMSDSVHDLPIVDLGASSLEEQGAQLCNAFRQVGLAYVKNHGIPEEEIEEAFSWSRKFFDLPQSEKDKAPHPASGSYHRGYSRVGQEKVSQNVFDAAALAQHRKVPDQKESFDLGSDAPDAAQPNIWPADAALPGFRPACVRFFDACSGLGERVLAAVAVGLGLRREAFAGCHARRDHQLRLLHYPPFAAALQARGLAEGVAAHSDFGTVTLLFQDGVGGLELEGGGGGGGGGGWRPVPRVEGAVVVNVGDLLMRWTNDELRSPIHRVRTPEEEEEAAGAETGVRMTRRRYSIPFFVSADPGTVVDCVPTCHGPGRPKRYEPVTAEEYYTMRMNALY